MDRGAERSVKALDRERQRLLHPGHLYSIRSQHTQAAGEGAQDPEPERQCRRHSRCDADRTGVHSPIRRGTDTADTDPDAIVQDTKR